MDDSSPESLAAAVSRCREAQASWASLSFGQRGAMLRSWRELLLEAKAEFATILRQQTGKSESEALGYELFFVCDAIGYWGRAAGRLLADRQPILHLFKHKRALSTHKPRGVVGLVASDRLPLLLTLGEAVPALMAGNGVILLPPATADGAALLGCALAEEAGFPPGLLRAVTGTEAVVLDLVGHADMVAYTGVADLGRRVSVRAAEQLKPSVLELEASDPMIVCRDADLDRAARACVWRATSPAAARAIGVERVYVDAKVYDAFIDRITRILAARVGDARPAPTIRAGAGREAEIVVSATVARIASYEHEAEALRMANDSPFGLSASVWSRDRAGAINIARRIEAGSVAINDHVTDLWIPELPLGGLKRSGIGRRMGPEGIRRYCEQQTIVVDRAFLGRWSPSHDRRARLFARLLDLVFRSGLRARLGG